MAFRYYQRSFERRPNTTLAITGGVLAAIGDTVAQLSHQTFGKEHDPIHTYDPLRTIRFFTYGFAMSPLIGRWNHFLEHKFPLRDLTRTGSVSMTSLSQRVITDQTIFAPLGLVVFVGTMGAMEGQTLPQIRQKYDDIYINALLANWKLWPALQLINFCFIPLAYRVPFSSTCGVFWTWYLSILNSREKDYSQKQTTIEKNSKFPSEKDKNHLI